MALVHQKLYQAKDLSRIRLDEYVAELAALVMQSSQVAQAGIALRLELEPVSVLLDTAIPMIFLVGYPNAEIRERAMRLHPLGFFIKPMRIADIHAAIASIPQQ